MSDLKNLFAFLDQKRQEQNLSINDLARKARVHPSSVRRMLRGESDPFLSTFLRVLHALGYQLALVPAQTVKEAGHVEVR